MRNWIVTLFILIPTLYCGGPKKKAEHVRVSFLSGSAEQKVPGSDWTALKSGQEVPLNASIRTGSGAVLDLSVSGTAGIRLLGGSSMEIGDIVSTGKVKVSDGNILVKVGKLDAGRSFQVETPTAIASVRGTQFWGQVTKAGEEGVFAVRDGSVEVTLKESGKSFVCSKGDAVDIAPGAKKFDKRAAKKEELGAMEQIDEIHL